MNTIYYRNEEGKVQAVKVEGAYKYLDERRVRWSNKGVNHRTTRRPTMAEADAKMLKDGFRRAAA